MDICSHFFLEEMKAYVSSIIYKGVEFSGQMVTLCLTIGKLADCFAKQSNYFISLIAVYEDSDFSTHSSLFSSSYPAECEVTFHCSFDLHFPND